jgi:peptidoglycan hydrolase-like protein with peptidoglycan-binding domain
VPAVKEPAVRLQRDRTVMRAQALLAQLDLYRDAIDGLLGERTIAAIRDFQKSMSMAETGKVSAALLEALEEHASAANSDFSDRQRGQGSDDAAVEAAETLQVIDIMHECRGKEAEWVYIVAINRYVLCGGLSAESPN